MANPRRNLLDRNRGAHRMDARPSAPRDPERRAVARDPTRSVRDPQLRRQLGGMPQVVVVAERNPGRRGHGESSVSGYRGAGAGAWSHGDPDPGVVDDPAKVSPRVA